MVDTPGCLSKHSAVVENGKVLSHWSGQWGSRARLDTDFDGEVPKVDLSSERGSWLRLVHEIVLVDNELVAEFVRYIKIEFVVVRRVVGSCHIYDSR